MVLAGLGVTFIISKFNEDGALTDSKISYTEFFKFYLEKDDV